MDKLKEQKHQNRNKTDPNCNGIKNRFKFEQRVKLSKQKTE